MKITIELVRADITTLTVDAIVNAANSTLLGGGGVDGAIHRAAGPKLLQACRKIRETDSPSGFPDGLPTGEAVLTPGFDLPAQFVIHTVGPVWSAHTPETADQLLARAYRSCLELACSKAEISSIAFPAISTGVYGFPASRAARIVLSEFVQWQEESAANEPARADVLRVIFCFFSSADQKLYRDLLDSRGFSSLSFPQG